jgi:hypothetical protein
VLDEIAQWPTTSGAKQLFEAVTSAAAKIETARMVLLTTAGSPSHWSHKVREHARTDPLWRVHEVHGPPPWMDFDGLDDLREALSIAVRHGLAEDTGLCTPPLVTACGSSKVLDPVWRLTRRASPTAKAEVRHRTSTG